MEPFSITCTTCQTRLRVRDESALGQILACPKCGSMVLVESPQGTPSVASETKDSSAADIPAAPSKPSVESSPDARPNRTFKFREDYELTAEDAAPKTPRKPATPAPPKQSTAGKLPQKPLAHQDLKVPPDDAPQGLWRRHQQWILIGGAAIVGIALALLVVGILSSRRMPDAQEPNPLTQSDPLTTAVPDSPPPGGETTDLPPTVPQTPPSEDSSPGGSTASVTADSHPAPVEPAPVEPGPVEPTVPAQDLAADNPQKTGSADSPAAPDTGAPPDLAPHKEPHETDVVHPAPETPDTGSSKPASPPAVDGGHGETDPDAGEATARENSRVADQLSATVMAIEFEQIPLADFAKFVFDFTTIPVTLDIDGLFATGVTPETKLEFQLRGVTVEQVLTAALEPLKLGASVQQGQLLITPKETESRDLSTRRYDVSDLARSEDDVKSLGGQIRSMIAAKSWLDAGGEATLSETDEALDVVQTAVAHFKIARFLDQLRAARGLLPRSELPPAQLDVTPVFVQAAGALNASVGANFSEATPLRLILDYLQTETDLRLLVDWQSLATVGLLPSTPMSLSQAEQPLRSLLDSWLAPLKLDYRVIDAKTIQIVSQASLLAQPEIAFYPIKSLADSEAEKLIEEIKNTVGMPFFAADGARGFITLDPPSRCLLVSLPQPQQRTLADWLRTNRKTGIDAGPRS